MNEIKTTYKKGDEVYILSLNTLAIVESCIVVGKDEYYRLRAKDSATVPDTVLFSMYDLYMPKKILSKVALVEELELIKSKKMQEDIEQKMKIRALLEYIDDEEVTEKFYTTRSI